MWIVYTKEEGILTITDDYNYALEIYEREKKKDLEYHHDIDEWDTDVIDTIIAKIDKRHFIKEYQNMHGGKYILTEESY